MPWRIPISPPGWIFPICRPGEQVFYRVTFEDLANPGTMSQSATGRLRTAPLGGRDIRFVFSGDEAGQGWGINPVWGGYRIYEAMRAVNPDFFIHQGDQIYADGPLKEEVKLDDGTVWKNVVTPAKSKVAETIDDYRGCFAYNLTDDNKRRFASEVPFLVQWDDHETHNNWYPGESLAGDARYKQVTSADALAANARRAMFEYNTFRPNALEAERVYRRFPYGPLLEVFILDERSYRGPNGTNRQPSLTPDAAFLGPKQLLWLKQGLLASKATWKVIASDMPIGIQVPDAQPWIPKGNFEAWANGDNGMPLGPRARARQPLRFPAGTTPSAMSSGSPPMCITARRSATTPPRAPSGISIPSGNSSQARSMPAPSAPTTWIRASGPI